MDSATLALLKAYCHVDHNDDDTLLQELYAAAVEYLSGAGVPISNTAIYRHTVCVIVLEWYDGAPIGNVTVGVQRLINQLELCSDPSF